MQLEYNIQLHKFPNATATSELGITISCQGPGLGDFCRHAAQDDIGGRSEDSYETLPSYEAPPKTESRGRFFKELQKMNPFIGIHLKDTDFAWFFKCVWLIVLFSRWLKGATSTMIGTMCRFCFTIFSKTQIAETTVLTQRFSGSKGLVVGWLLGTHTHNKTTPYFVGTAVRYFFLAHILIVSCCLLYVFTWVYPSSRFIIC